MQLRPEFRACFYPFSTVIVHFTFRKQCNGKTLILTIRNFDSEHNFAYFFFSITSNFQITLATQTSSSLFVQEMKLKILHRWKFIRYLDFFVSTEAATFTKSRIKLIVGRVVVAWYDSLASTSTNKRSARFEKEKTKKGYFARRSKNNQDTMLFLSKQLFPSDKNILVERRM